jgi:hypothetical protein
VKREKDCKETTRKGHGLRDCLQRKEGKRSGRCSLWIADPRKGKATIKEKDGQVAADQVGGGPR